YARDDVAVPYPMVSMGNKPIALAVGCNPSPAVVHVFSTVGWWRCESAFVICSIVICWKYFPANGAFHLKGVFGIDDPGVRPAFVKDFCTVDRTASCTQVKRPGNLRGSHQVDNRLIIPINPIICGLNNFISDFSGTGKGRNIFSGNVDFGIRVNQSVSF